MALLFVFALSFLSAPTSASNQGFEATSHWQKRFATFISSHPQATLDEAVMEANRILRQEGLDTHVFFRSADPWTLAKDRQWSLQPPKKVNPCDQRVGVISAVQAQKKTLNLPHKNGDLRANLPEGAFFAQIRMTSTESKGPVATFYSPVLSAPMGASEDGQQIYFRYLLSKPNKAILSWFKNAVKDSEELVDEPPFLVLAVNRAGKFQFIGDLEAYEDQEAEVDEGDGEREVGEETSTRAYEFKPYGWVLHFSEACEQAENAD